MQLCVMGMIEEGREAVCVIASHSDIGTSIGSVNMLKMPHIAWISLLMITRKSVNFFTHHMTIDLLAKIALSVQSKEYFVIMQHCGVTVILPLIHYKEQQWLLDVAVSQCLLKILWTMLLWTLYNNVDSTCWVSTHPMLCVLDWWALICVTYKVHPFGLLTEASHNAFRNSAIDRW